MDVTLERVKVEDPKKAGRTLYEIRGSGAKGRLFLVVIPGKLQGHRLVVADPGGSVKYVLSLDAR